MNLKPVYVQHQKASEAGASGLFFGNKYILTTFHALDLSTDNNDLKKILTKPNVLHKVKNQHQFKVFESSKDQFFAYSTFYFCNNGIRECLKDYFLEFDFDHKDPVSKENIFKVSIFLILTVDGNIDEDKFHEHLYTLYQYLDCNAFIGKEVATISTPFGKTPFLNTFNTGIISNIFRMNLMVIDCGVVPGCEGGIVYSKNSNFKELLGIIITYIHTWKTSSVGLAIACKLDVLLGELISSGSGLNYIPTLHPAPKDNAYESINKSLAQVICGSQWGSAVLFDKSKGIFITNSHVIDIFPIVLKWNNIKYSAKKIYSSKNHEPYDLAVLKVTSENFFKNAMVSIRICSSPIKVGNKVWAAGYPLFNHHKHHCPTITSGFISKVGETLFYTNCTVLPGASGGAIVNNQTELVGIIVANMIGDNIQYPKFNLAIPIRNIIEIFQEYSRSENDTVFEKLKLDKWKNLAEWNFVNCKL